MCADFGGKVVLITGASSGIGAATALHFAKLGAQLVLTGRNQNRLEEVKKQILNLDLKSSINVVTLTGDLIEEEHVRDIIEQTIKNYGKLDILVNNAAIIEFGTIETTNLEQFDRIFGTNVRATYLLTTLAVPYLIKSKGNIVNVSSVAAIRCFPNVLSYCMSKAALDQFTRCVCLNLAEKQVRVNSVNPGVVETNLFHEFEEEQRKQFFERTKGQHPLGRLATCEEVAKVITFLASDDASYITGATLSVDGGKQVMCPF